jgi:hypothetical protein
MSELTIVQSFAESPAMSAEAISVDLSAQAACVAVSLAAVLGSSCEEGDAVAAAVALLRSWADFAQESSADSSGVPLTDSPLQRVVAGLDLSIVERDLVLLAGLAEEHPAFADIMRLLHPRGEPRASVLLADRLTAARLEGPSALRRLLGEGNAVTSGLLKVEGDGPIYDRSLDLAEGIWAAMQGHRVRLPSFAWTDVGAVPGGLDRWVARAETRAAVRALRSPESRVLSVATADHRIALSRVAALGRAAGRRLLAAELSLSDTESLQLLRLHALANAAVPVVVAASNQSGDTLSLGPHHGPLVVCCNSTCGVNAYGIPVHDIDIGPIEHHDRRDAWMAAVPVSGAQAADFATCYRLDPAITHEVGVDLLSTSLLVDRGTAIAPRDVALAIRARARGRLPAGSRLTTPDVDWSRLVLEPKARGQLTDAVARLRHQSLVLEEWGFRSSARADGGVRLLFTGPPGTGKSLAAEVIATAAACDLLWVDLSRVVSKWLGETEKNLAAMFEAAEQTQAVLFMDEADALFGARTEVRDSNDRYANLETSYLLQRLDQFDGLVVLATNLKQNIDAAFLRRMDFVVDFDLPGVEARAELWELHLPERVRGEHLDLPGLARRYDVPGGWIRNAAIGAAFLAADEGTLMTTHHLATALRREYDKAGKPFPGRLPTSGRVDSRAAEAIGTAIAAARLTKEEA